MIMMKNIKISFTKSQCNVRCRQTLAKYLKLSCYRHKLRYIEENEVYNVGLTQWTVGSKLFHSHKGKTPSFAPAKINHSKTVSRQMATNVKLN